MRIQATIVCTSLVLAVSQVAAVPVSLHPAPRACPWPD